MCHTLLLFVFIFIPSKNHYITTVLFYFIIHLFWCFLFLLFFFKFKIRLTIHRYLIVQLRTCFFFLILIVSDIFVPSSISYLPYLSLFIFFVFYLLSITFVFLSLSNYLSLSLSLLHHLFCVKSSVSLKCYRIIEKKFDHECITTPIIFHLEM